MTKHAIWLAKSEKETYISVSPDGYCIFGIIKQMDHTIEDVVGENCVCNEAAELAPTDEDKMNAWVEHNARLLNVEFELTSNELLEVSPTAPSQCVCDPDLQSTQQDEMRQGCWPIWHHSWIAESCWWARHWAGKTIGGVYFQQLWHTIRLGRELQNLSYAYSYI